MKINYLKHIEINKTKWDACIANAKNRIVYAESWYLDIVNNGWDALVAGDYEVVMPLTRGKKYGINYLYTPFFTQQLGVFSKKEPDKVIVEDFLNAIPAKFRYIEINLNKGYNFPVGGFQTTQNVNIELSLDNTYSDLYSGYSSNTRRNLKKAMQHNLSVINDIKPGELISLFRNNKGKNIKNIKTAHYNSLSQIMDKSLKEQHAEIYGINSGNGKLCAGAFFLQSYESFIFLFSASNDESKENGAMFLIIDHFIRKHSGNKTILDFEGSNIKSLARFYKGFGAVEFYYPQIKKNDLPGVIKIFKQ